MKSLKFVATALAFYVTVNETTAQHSHDDTKLHINPKWSECSFEIDPSLTQQQWHKFTREAGLVAYFRPLIDAKPLGAKHFEVSLLEWKTKFNDSDPAWNNTFVHPDSVHWLKEGSQLPFPGITARVGITNKTDVGVYFTKNIGANYGFWGAQLQHNLVNDLDKKWSASARLSFTTMFGPDDLKFNTYGLDLIASKELPLYFKWASIAPYAGVSTFLFNAREITEKVDLHNENVIGAQGMIGAVLKLSKARLAAEYNLASVNTFSFKLGVGF